MKNVVLGLEEFKLLAWCFRHTRFLPVKELKVSKLLICDAQNAHIA